MLRFEIVYNGLQLNSLKLDIAHFPNIQPAKQQWSTSGMYNRCAKAKENMHALLCLEQTNKSHNISTECVPFALATGETVKLKPHSKTQTGSEEDFTVSRVTSSTFTHYCQQGVYIAAPGTLSPLFKDSFKLTKLVSRRHLASVECQVCLRFSLVLRCPETQNKDYHIQTMYSHMHQPDLSAQHFHLKTKA